MHGILALQLVLLVFFLALMQVIMISKEKQRVRNVLEVVLEIKLVQVDVLIVLKVILMIKQIKLVVKFVKLVNIVIF